MVSRTPASTVTWVSALRESKAHQGAIQQPLDLGNTRVIPAPCEPRWEVAPTSDHHSVGLTSDPFDHRVGIRPVELVDRNSAKERAVRLDVAEQVDVDSAVIGLRLAPEEVPGFCEAMYQVEVTGPYLPGLGRCLAD